MEKRYENEKNTIKSCLMCYNAKIAEDLTDDNDYSACTVSKYAADGIRMMLCSGAGKPVRIETEKWDERAGWYKIAEYFPKFCPNCGRKIIEYENK